METDEVRARPLDSFGTDIPMQLCALWKPSAPFFPKSKKSDLFPAESISRKRSLFLFPFIFPTGAFP